MDIEISRPADIFRPKSESKKTSEFDDKIGRQLEKEYAEYRVKAIGKKVRPGTRYKFKEDITIIRMVRNEFPTKTIAKTLSRSYGSVSTRKRWLYGTEINSLDDLKIWHRKRGTE